MNRIEERVERFNQTKIHLIIFPEGTTSNGQAVLGFKRGAFASLSPLKVFCLKYNRRSFCPVLDHISSMAGNVILTLCQFYNVLEVVEYKGAFYQKDGVGVKKEEELNGEEERRTEGGEGEGGKRKQKEIKEEGGKDKGGRKQIEEGINEQEQGREGKKAKGKEEKRRMKEGVEAKMEEGGGRRREVGEEWEEYARMVKEVMSKELEVKMVGRQLSRR